MCSNKYSQQTNIMTKQLYKMNNKYLKSKYIKQKYYNHKYNIWEYIIKFITPYIIMNW